MVGPDSIPSPDRVLSLRLRYPDARSLQRQIELTSPPRRFPAFAQLGSPRRPYSRPSQAGPIGLASDSTCQSTLYTSSIPLPALCPSTPQPAAPQTTFPSQTGSFRHRLHTPT